MEFRHRYNFSGGQVNVTTDEARPSSAVRSLVNGTLRREGGIEKRPGFRTLFTSDQAPIGLGEGSLVVTGVLTNFLFLVSANSITRAFAQKDGTTGRSALSVTGGDSAFGTFCRVLQMNGVSGGTRSKYIIFVGSEEVPVHYNGSTTTRTVLSAPGAATVATGAAGVLTGAYTYKVTFVNDFGETSAGTASATVNPVTQKVDLSSIPTGSTTEPYAVRYRKIYRTEAGGSTYKLVTTLTDNTTTTYTDNTADGALGATPPSINRASQIPRGRDGAVFQSRLYIGNNADANTNGVNMYPYRVWFSKIDDFLDFNATDQNGTYIGYFDIPTLEAVTGMMALGTRLIIFTARSIWAWDGYRIVEITRAVGTPYGATIAAGDNALYFLDFGGVYRFAGGTPVKLSEPIDQTINSISDFTACFGAYWDNAYYLITGTLSNTAEDISFTNSLVVYDELHNRWATWKMGVSSTIKTIAVYGYRSGNTIEETLLYVGVNGSGVFQHVSSIFTDGTTTGGITAAPVQFAVETGPDFGGSPHAMKRYSKLILKGKYCAGANAFYRTARERDWLPLGTMNGDTLEATLFDTADVGTSDGYFIDVRVTHSERGQPAIIEGFSYAQAEEDPDRAQF